MSATLLSLSESPLHTSIFVQDRARRYATTALDGQVHRDGKAAIEHAKRVAARFHDPYLIAIALLHDVVEDTDISVAQLAEEFGHRIADGVDALSRGKVEPWNAYIRRVLCNEDAVRVKIADIEDNIARCTVSDRMFPKLRMYTETLDLLRSSSY